MRTTINLDEDVLQIRRELAAKLNKLITPTERHWVIFRELLERGQATANLVSDAHLATLAMENGCVLYSTDSDFSRFPGLKWRNPLI